MSNASNELRRLAAIMFTDIVGYSAITQRNESHALLLLSEHNGIVRGILPAHHGKVIKTVGDAFLVEFGSALDAVRAAIAIQSALHTRNGEAPLDPIHIRIGIHLGDVVFREDDVFGDGVNIAARIQSVAEPDGICVSEDVARQVQTKIDVPLVNLGKPALKNIEMAVGVYAVQLPWMAKSANASASVRGKRPASRLKVALAMLLVVLAAGSAWWYLKRDAASAVAAASGLAQSNSIAVLPFTNMSANKDDDFFADGMTEDLLTQLAHISGLKVISRTSVMQYKGTKKSIREIAKELGVANILEGSVRRGDNRYRINAQLIDADRDQHLWAKNYDRAFKDLLTVQAEVTTEIAAALKVALKDVELEQLSRYAKGNPEAYLHYLRGKELVSPHPGETREQLEQGRAEFEKTVELDPGSSLGYSGLAVYHFRIPKFDGSPVKVSNAKAESYLNKALALDARSSDALRILALLRGLGQWRWREAEQAAKMALEASPSDAAAWDVYHASVLLPTGRLREALDAEKRALSLAPNNEFYALNVAGLYYYMRQFDDSISAAKAALTKNPGALHFHRLIARVHEYRGELKDAIAEYRLAKLTKATFPSESDIEPLEKALAANGAKGYWATRHAFQKQRSLAEPGLWYLAARTAAMAGEKAEALNYLERAVEELDLYMAGVKNEPAFDSIRGDPQFLTILKRMNLD